MQFKITLIMVLIFTGLIQSCKEEKAIQNGESESPSQIDSLNIPPLKGLKPSLQLVTPATEDLKKWNLYSTIAPIVDSLNSGKSLHLTSKVQRLEKAFETEKQAKQAAVNPIPETFRSNAIQARMLALQNAIMVLKNNISKNKPDTTLLAKNIVTCKNALQNLNLQVNETYSLSIEEMLKQAQEIPDSILIDYEKFDVDTIQNRNNEIR